jgi:hypothetical protein
VSSAAQTGGAAAQTFLTTLAASPVDTIITGLQTATTNIGNTITSVGASATELIQPTIDIATPDLKVLVNLGYGSVDHGYSTSPANVQTPFGVFPHVPPQEILAALQAGTEQGIHDFSHDLGTLLTTPPDVTLAPLTQLATNVSNNLSAGLTTVTGALSSPESFIAALQAANTQVTDAISSSAADAYATLLPTADIVNGLVTALPSYDVNLFLDGVEMMLNGDVTGGLVYAFGAPLAADTAAVVLLGGFEFRVLEHAATAIYYDITGKTPPAPGLGVAIYPKAPKRACRAPRRRPGTAVPPDLPTTGSAAAGAVSAPAKPAGSGPRRTTPPSRAPCSGTRPRRPPARRRCAAAGG